MGAQSIFRPADASIDDPQTTSTPAASDEEEMVCVAFYPSMDEEDVEASLLVVKDR